MYYGKQNSLNSDYYNSYKGSSYQYKDERDYLTLILKILVILLLLGVLFIGFLFISNKTKMVENGVDRQRLFKVVKEEPSAKREKLPKEIVKEITLEKDNKPHLTQDDIANIISIIMQYNPEIFVEQR